MAGQKFTTADLLTLFLLRGNKGVEDRHAECPIPRLTFLKACEMLRQEDEKKHAQMERLMNRLAPMGTGEGRGRKAPEVGDEVVYSAQQTLKDGAPVGQPYARIPVHTLGISKEELVQVIFRDGEVVLRAVPREEAAEVEDNAEA